MKKFILKLDLHDDKDKRKALKIVSALPGIDSITMSMKEGKLTVVGSVDPISVVSKLRKFWSTDIISVGPAKEPEKKEEAKKEEPKKEEGKAEKKEEPKKEDAKKEEAPKEESKKKEEGKEEEKKRALPQPPVGMLMPYRPYYPPINTYYNYQPHHYQPHHYQPHHYQPHHHSIEENPNACVIC